MAKHYCLDNVETRGRKKVWLNERPAVCTHFCLHVKPLVSIWNAKYQEETYEKEKKIMPKEDNKMIQLTKIILKQTAHYTARIVAYSGYEHRSIDILNDLGWETLDQRHNKQLAVCVYHRLLSEKTSSTATTK